MPNVAKLIRKALKERDFDKIEGMLPSKDKMIEFSAKSNHDTALQASSPNVSKLNQVIFYEKNRRSDENNKKLRKRPELKVGKVSSKESFAEDLLNYGFADSGLSVVSHGWNNKIGYHRYDNLPIIGRILPEYIRSPWRKIDPNYEFTSFTNFGTLPALITVANKLGYGYLSITACTIGKGMMEKNDALRASSKNPGFCCIINAGSKNVEGKDVLAGIRSKVDLDRHLPTVFTGVKDSIKEAISVFIARIIDSPETCYFLHNGKSFVKKSNYYKKGISVEQHIIGSIKGFLDFLYVNGIVNKVLNQTDYNLLSGKASDDILGNKLTERPDYVKEYNAKLLINKFYRKGTIEPDYFKNKGYEISDFASYISENEEFIEDISKFAKDKSKVREYKDLLSTKIVITETAAPKKDAEGKPGKGPQPLATTQPLNKGSVHSSVSNSFLG